MVSHSGYHPLAGVWKCWKDPNKNTCMHITSAQHLLHDLIGDCGGVDELVSIVPDISKAKVNGEQHPDSLRQLVPLGSFVSSTLLELLIPPCDVLKGFRLTDSSSRISESTIVSSEDWEDEAIEYDRASAHGPLAKG